MAYGMISMVVFLLSMLIRAASALGILLPLLYALIVPTVFQGWEEVSHDTFLYLRSSGTTTIETNETDVEKEKGLPLPIVITVVAVVLVGGGVAVYFLYFRKKLSNTRDGSVS